MMKKSEKKSRFLSYVLRHKPESISIELDKEGWAPLDKIIDNDKQQISEEEIIEVVNTNDKKRFELDLENRRIRAVQGHSVKAEIKMNEFAPTGPLYHGTIEDNIKSILKEGLSPGSRNHVHLSKDIQTATKVGKRRGLPVILEINARKMRADGLRLEESKNGVVLCKHVPPHYIKRLE